MGQFFGSSRTQELSAIDAYIKCLDECKLLSREHTRVLRSGTLKPIFSMYDHTAEMEKKRQNDCK